MFSSLIASSVPNQRSPTTIRKELKEREDRLAAVLNIEPVILEQIIVSPVQTHKLPEPTPPLINFTYPNYPITDYDANRPAVLRIKNSSAFKHIENSNRNAIASTSSPTTAPKNKNASSNIMSKSQISNLNESTPKQRSRDSNMTKSLNLTVDDVPAIRKIPDYMHIPNLWDIKIEKEIDADITMENRENQRESSSSSCSEWEFV